MNRSSAVIRFGGSALLSFMHSMLTQTLFPQDTMMRLVGFSP